MSSPHDAAARRRGGPEDPEVERPHRERPPKQEAPVLYAPEPEPALTGPVRVETNGYLVLGPTSATLRALRQDRVADRLAARDATLWGPDAAAETAVRLGWLDLPVTSEELLPRLAALRDELRADGLDRVVLCGMGGSSLAPEVICASAGVPLVVLDGTDPGQVRAALADLDRTVVVVASKSGTTVETDCHRRVLAAAGLDPARQFVAVTDPGSPLADLAAAEGWRAVFHADPNVGGRYSALSAFGLVPSALAGVDVAPLLADARAAAADPEAGLRLGAALGGCAKAGRDKVVIPETPDGFGAWAEQLLAESTGKAGTGLLPVVVPGPAPKPATTDDLHPVVPGGIPALGTGVTGPLGGAFYVWEYATAVAGLVLGVNPFDQPDVEAAKTATRALLDAPAAAEAPAFAEGPVEAYGTSASSLADALEALLVAVPRTGYVAVHAYLDRHADAAAAGLREALAARTPRPVTFGWGPRFLHSTGQYHKGGPPTGVFLQLTGAVAEDLAVPGRPYTLGQLQLAQALGDGRVLRERGRPVLRLHLTDRAAGLAAVLAALS